MQLNDQGIALIKRFEGLRLKAYQCPAGKWTIGYGHTGPDVFSGQRITIHLAEELLKQDLENICYELDTLLRRALNDNQFSSLVSFAYNCGIHNLAKSTLLRLINAGQDPKKEFLKWTFSNGKKLSGLERRRMAEAKLFDVASF